MTVARFLSVFYRHAARFERWRANKPQSNAERVAEQKAADARDVTL